MPQLFSERPYTTIRQPEAGNFYILAFFDCLFNSDLSVEREGFNHIKSLFVKTTDGFSIRIKRSDFSVNLRNKKTEKYRYELDELRNEDVFFVTEAMCEEILASPLSTKTDSFAINILEGICAYYFHNDWSSVDSSMEAHSIREMAINCGSAITSTDFLAGWLSIDTQDIADPNYVLPLFSILPTLSIYMSANITPTNRHAFRLKGVATQNVHNDFTLHLVDPSNNSMFYAHPFSDVIQHAPRFSLVNTYSPHYRLATHLLNEPKLLLDFGAMILSMEKIYQSKQDILENKHKLNQINQYLGGMEIMLKQLIDVHGLSVELSKPLSDFIDSQRKRRDSVYPTIDIMRPKFGPVSTSVLEFFDSHKIKIDEKRIEKKFEPSNSSAFSLFSR